MSAKASGAGIRLKWSGIYGAGGYQVYRSTSETGRFKKVDTVKDGTSWTDTKAEAGNAYFYKVLAYWKDDGHTYKGEFSSVVRAKARDAARLSAPKAEVKKNSGGAVRLSWGSIP